MMRSQISLFCFLGIAGVLGSIFRVFKAIRSIIISLILIITFTAPSDSKASAFQDILTDLFSVTCGTIYLFTKSSTPNTCTPILQLPSIFPNLPMIGWAKERLFINHHDMFPKNCARSNRPNPNNANIDFGFCRNFMITPDGNVKGLVPERAKAVGMLLYHLIINVFKKGEDPWSDIRKDWYIPPEDYIEVHNNVEPNARDWRFFVDVELGVTSTIPTVAAFPWSVKKINDMICVVTVDTLGILPAGCKFMQDPYVISKYHYFFHKSPPDPEAPGVEVSTADLSLMTCFGGQSCYIDAQTNAKAILPMSSAIVTCVNQMLVKTLISDSICKFDQINTIYNDSGKRANSPLYRFQQNLSYAVTAFLSLYIIITAMKMILGGEVPERGEIVKFIVKIILVTYFSIGINFGNNAGGLRYDGMMDFVLPVVFQGANELASIIMNLAPSGLCKFDSTKYASGYEYLALWDALDCRVSNYLGLDGIADLMSSGQNGGPNFDALNFSVPPWIYLIIPAAMTGNIAVVSLVLSYPFLVISVAAYMVYSFVVCMISITILAVLAPLFIPMVLFEYTKGYYESWLKLMISFVLQPMVVAIFMITMFAVYDLGFFGGCKFTTLNVATTFDGSPVNRKLFTIDQNKNSYANKDERARCVYSLGYMLNAPFSIVGNALSSLDPYQDNVVDQDGDVDQTSTSDSQTASTIVGSTATSTTAVVTIDGSSTPVSVGTTSVPDQTSDDAKKHHGSFLSNIRSKEGLFFSFPVLHGGIKQFTLNILVACLCLYVMYNLSSSVAEFAADMTEGVVIEGAHVKPEIKGSGDKGDKKSEDGDRGKSKGDEGDRGKSNGDGDRGVSRGGGDRGVSRGGGDRGSSLKGVTTK